MIYLNNYIKYNKLLVLFTFVLIYLYLFVTSIFIPDTSSLLAVYTLILSIVIVYKSMDNIYMFILFFFFLLYQIPIVLYFCLNIEISSFSDFNDKIMYSETSRIHSLLIFTLFLGKFILKKNQVKLIVVFPSIPNLFSFYFFLIISILVLVFGQSGQTIFETGAYATGLSDKSTLYEYFIIFFALANVFSSRRGFQFYLLQFILVLYIYKSLLYGGRIEVLQVLLLNFYILIGDKKLNVSTKSLFFLLILGYYINILFANIRNQPSILVDFELQKILTPFSINENTNLYSSNEGEVFHSSARLIGLINLGYLDILERIYSFFGFVLSIFVPSSFLPSSASLITFMKDEYNAGGGGLISIYFFCWAWYFGPIIIGLFIVYFLNKVNYSKNKYLVLYFFMICSTFPRWFAYNPIILFKICFWIIPLFFIFNKIKISYKPVK